ncbi:MAG TPA: thymidine kinase [Candidatus Nesterenkonia stercoripullorum]|uniref:Thymidine kinase n=1 Tax=Candidatus Nesterenkonia stercoripullorum TaxID=2838701 RepID=A0A9D1URX6_9MICC|nr:thymidine kinase [Candidatus Nesterenkonia stercoripullorum]
MAKLYFRYGAMNSGKSTALLQAAYNYEERDQRVLLAKPALDTKGADQIVSRLGVTRDVDVLVPADAGLRELFTQYAQAEPAGSLLEGTALGADRTLQDQVKPVACLLVDEAQFLTAEQVDDLLRIAVLDGVPVLAYGIRTDFRTRPFPGSARLMDIAHSLEELKTVCRCGRKAVFNTRRVGDEIILEGDQVAIDGEQVWYESLCAACYLEISAGRLG